MRGFFCCYYLFLCSYSAASVASTRCWGCFAGCGQLVALDQNLGGGDGEGSRWDCDDLFFFFFFFFFCCCDACLIDRSYAAIDMDVDNNFPHYSRSSL